MPIFAPSSRVNCGPDCNLNELSALSGQSLSVESQEVRLAARRLQADDEASLVAAEERVGDQTDIYKRLLATHRCALKIYLGACPRYMVQDIGKGSGTIIEGQPPETQTTVEHNP